MLLRSGLLRHVRVWKNLGLCSRITVGAQTRHKSTDASEDEVKHFRELAPTWWDTNGSQRILHKMNLARLDFVQRTIRNQVKIQDPEIFVPAFNYKEFLPEYVCDNIQREIQESIESSLDERPGMSVLDVGCGGGILSESLARLKWVKSVQGIDLTHECIMVAKAHSKKDPMLERKLSYECKALEDVTGQFNIITCMEMLEHVDVPSEILRHCWTRLSPDNGVLFLSTINRDLISWFTTIYMGENVLKVVPKGTHHLSKYINSKEIIAWFNDNYSGQFRLLDLKGTMYLPLRGWVEHDCSDVGNYFMAIQRLE
ncbi:Coq3p [Saccharomyces cerevisiae x Saccharomyces kudriavzevii VIN7]|uniref:Ubiquinone biosynthesis O-methyltransferase, mitochondrial n=1 Tax=Saccharomyces cerevisiae x Saccharomyces kudriavzevii (strain VIN7) TaxID=1095631 RepID=H0H0R5_SACCK|nr:Coq3p [Saccharomyces cerevisiae x Saccharomyces kudriavzevii VIN7]